jgi:hypothetical protein
VTSLQRWPPRAEETSGTLQRVGSKRKKQWSIWAFRPRLMLPLLIRHPRPTPANNEKRLTSRSAERDMCQGLQNQQNNLVFMVFDKTGLSQF